MGTLQCCHQTVTPLIHCSIGPRPESIKAFPNTSNFQDVWWMGTHANRRSRSWDILEDSWPGMLHKLMTLVGGKERLEGRIIITKRNV